MDECKSVNQKVSLYLIHIQWIYLLKKIHVQLGGMELFAHIIQFSEINKEANCNELTKEALLSVGWTTRIIIIISNWTSLMVIHTYLLV